MKVFEIFDTSDEEHWYFLAMFSSLSKAKTELLQVSIDTDGAITEYAEETETIEILEVKSGWKHDKKSVFTLEREQYYNEELDDYFWRNVDSKAT